MVYIISSYLSIRYMGTFGNLPPPPPLPQCQNKNKTTTTFKKNKKSETKPKENLTKKRNVDFDIIDTYTYFNVVILSKYHYRFQSIYFKIL